MPGNSHSRFIPTGMTRDCLDPWVYVQVGTDGGISPCCVRGPIGNLAGQSLAEVMNGASARDLRLALLSGQPDAICHGCGLRGVTYPAALQAKVRHLLNSVTLPVDFDTENYLDANPDVKQAGAEPTRHFLDWGRLEGREVAAGNDMRPIPLFHDEPAAANLSSRLVRRNVAPADGNALRGALDPGMAAD